MDILAMAIIGVGVIFGIVFIISIFTGMSQKGMEKTLTKSMSAIAKAQNNVIKENEKILRENANKTSDINKDAVQTITHAIKEGFTDEDANYCKHCGKLIDVNSKFCKFCGKEQ